ncbi:S8 family peptidase [Nonomuraea candida]|uniref:S8 family peptidase n=1 Tax=Nonomuraea candida TaxID=359159 RepID=UPI000AC9FB5F|nr:S8 family serine peptidase [Nonomuraea candida]
MNRRPIRRLLSVAAILLLPLLPSGALAADATTRAAQEGPWVEPGLGEKLAGGARLRVNVVTRARGDLPAAASAGPVLQTLSRLPVVTLRADQAALERLAGQPGVVSVSEDRPAPPALGRSIPLIGADRTRQAGLTGAGSVVAVLDTGVAVNHPFLGGRVVAEACFSPSDPDYSATSLCPDGSDEQEGPGSADSESGPCANSELNCDHGTHVAGIVAGDGEGVEAAEGSGVAPEAGLVAVQIFSRFDTDDFCGPGASPCVLSFTSAQLAGLEKVLQLRSELPIVAANLSLGGGRNTAACDNDTRKPVIDGLRAAGVATVIAAGNDGFTDAISAPACVSSAVAVGSTTDGDAVSGFSNRSPLLDLFAPGTDIVSSVSGDTYDSMSGTSMAAPHVAGAFAVMRQAFPGSGVAELESMLKDSGRSIAHPGGPTPRIQLDDAALGAAVRPGPDQFFSSRGRILDNVQVSANSTMAVQVAGTAGLPATGLRAVALNVAAKGDLFNSGSVAVHASDEQEPSGSPLFYDATRYASTLIIAKAGADGRIKVVNRSTGPVRVTLDVHGHTLAQAAGVVGGAYVPITPVRVADRTVVPALGNHELATSGMTGLPATGVDAVALTVMLKSPSTGTIRVYAAGDVFPADANADYPANVPTQFFTIVKPGAGGKINLHNLGFGTVEISVDVMGYFSSAQRGSLLKAIGASPVARGLTIAAGGTKALNITGVAGIPASGVSALGLAVVAKGAANGVVSVVPLGGPSTARVVAYAAGKDTAGFTIAAARPDGTVLLKNEGTAQVTISVDAYAALTAR